MDRVILDLLLGIASDNRVEIEVLRIRCKFYLSISNKKQPEERAWKVKGKEGGKAGKGKTKQRRKETKEGQGKETARKGKSKQQPEYGVPEE